MAFSAGRDHVFIFVICSLLFSTHARPAIDPSDLKALSIVLRRLGIDPIYQSGDPCDTAGVGCERRLSRDNAYVLRVTRIAFNSQRLRGFLSPAIGRLTELRELSLSDNRLVDSLPPQISQCRKLQVLDLKNNKFSGEVPPKLSLLTRLRVLDLSSNQFSGKLSFLKDFPKLEILSLADNLFTGKVPASVRSYRNLKFFDFSRNSLLQVPDQPLTNKATTSATFVPKRYVLEENSTRPSSRKNKSAPAVSPAKAPSSAVASHSKKHSSTKTKILRWAVGFLAGAVAGTISGFVFSLLFKLALAAIRGGDKDKGPAIFSPLIKKAGDLAFLEKEDGVASMEIIGRGGCGEVYKAELPGCEGKMIAIKKIIQPPKEAAELTEDDSKVLNKKMRQIRSEIQTVGQIRHRNLLPLLAHVSRPDCHYLVYEFMKNGSLQDMLMSVSQGRCELDWFARHKIALGIAAGLEYLHCNHNPRIIHRDLKPANVLLDDDIEPRIADFGLAKIIPEDRTHITSTNVAGTVGFIAPEYHQTLKFTEKCDIYSFGVLLGALVMGKLPSDHFFLDTDEISLVKWLRNVLVSNNPSRAIDPSLLGNGYEEQILLVLKIACFCTHDNPKERPNSKEVRCMLSQINPGG